MISLKQHKQGFTIVELLIVIVVIGILSLLVITTYGGIQQKARNAKRQADMKSIQTHIESYFTQRNHYPSLTDMNDQSWLAANLPSLDFNAMIDPLNGTQSRQLVSSPTAKSYAYAVHQTDGTTSCETDDAQCATYTLTATFEGSVNGATTYSKSNLD